MGATVEVPGRVCGETWGEFRARDAGRRRTLPRRRVCDGPLGARLPGGVSQLCFRSPGFVAAAERLAQLFALFALTLERLRSLGSAEVCGPDVSL